MEVAMYKYETSGTCSEEIYFDIRDNKIHDVSFKGGCDGNLKALSILVEGMEVGEVVKKLKGIDCGGRGTSCGAQLATALTALSQQ
jgi:uncharacterized protein (TIGR03905 family)